MFVPSLLKIYFGLGWQNRLLKKRFGLSNGQKGNELRLWDGKKIICKCSLSKNIFKTIIIPWGCFCHKDKKNDLDVCL